jgi:hypothetical protein
LTEKLKLGSVFIWLDPIQKAIFDELCGKKDSSEKRFLIIGPASTGKTVLIQLAVLRILIGDAEKKVLIILPDDNLVKKYNKFFENSFLDESDQEKSLNEKIPDENLAKKNETLFEGQKHRERIVIGKISDADVQKCIKKDSPDIFIDEFSAVKIGNKTLVDDLAKGLGEDQLFCATMDFRQNMEFVGFGSPGNKNIFISTIGFIGTL